MNDEVRLDEELLKFADDLTAELGRGEDSRLDGFAERCDTLLALIEQLQSTVEAVEPLPEEPGERE